MSFTVQQLQADVERKVHGAVSQSFFGSLNEAARWVNNSIDPYEMKRIAYLESALYDQIDKYYLPLDLKDNKIVDIRKQLNRTYRDSFDSVSNRTFDKYASTADGAGAWRSFTILSEDGTKYIRIKDRLPNTTLTIQQADSLTSNGTWNVYGNVSNLQVDQLNYLSGNGSLRFNVGTTTSGALENADISKVDISSYIQVGAIFAWIYLPQPTFLSNVTLIWGSSALDYASFTVTAPHNNVVWVQGWNLMKFPLDGYVTTGNPDFSNINRIRMNLQTTGQPMNGVIIDNIVARKGVLYEMEYYSSYMFSDPQTNEWKASTYDFGDTINLGVTSYNILMLRCAVIEAQEVRNSNTDVNQIAAELNQEMKNYLASNKSEYIPPTESWYKPVDPTRSQFYGWGLGGF